jgi:mRNA-degrading endonuclease RelE of RelBE toxin-antitoxin system
MTIETDILKNVEKLPESVKKALFEYTEFLVNRHFEEANKTEKPTKRGGLGIWKGKIWMADDFDEPLEDLKDYM